VFALDFILLFGVNHIMNMAYGSLSCGAASPACTQAGAAGAGRGFVSQLLQHLPIADGDIPLPHAGKGRKP
jgi:branched-subunit amino acid ABC-type transport system permease component